MTLVANAAREMSDIKDTFKREFGEDIEDQLTTAGLAMALRRLGVVGREQAQEVTGTITEPTDDPQEQPPQATWCCPVCGATVPCRCYVPPQMSPEPSVTDIETRARLAAMAPTLIDGNVPTWE